MHLDRGTIFFLYIIYLYKRRANEANTTAYCLYPALSQEIILFNQRSDAERK